MASRNAQYLDEQAAAIAHDWLKRIGAGELDPADVSADPERIPCRCGAERRDHAGDKAGGAAGRCRRYQADQVQRRAREALAAMHRGFRDNVRIALAQWRHVPRRRVEDFTDDGDPGVRFSDYLKCRAAIGFRLIPPDGFTPDEEPKYEAFMGTMIHEGYSDVIAALYPWRKLDHPVKLAGLNRYGKADCWDPIVGALEEYKSAGDWRWDETGAEGVANEWLGQAMMYGLALEESGQAVTLVRIVVIRRENGDDAVFEFDWDDEARGIAREARDWLLATQQLIDLGIHPERDLPGPTTSPLCRRCFARSTCWPMERAAALGRTPESLDRLGEVPDPEEVVLVLHDVWEAQRLKKRATDAHSEVKALMGGLAPGEYGEFEIRPGARGGPNHKRHAEDVIDRIKKLAETGATLTGEQILQTIAEVPVPQYARKSPTLAKVPLTKPRAPKPDLKPVPQPADTTSTTIEAGAA
jgi:hypothetical protein